MELLKQIGISLETAALLISGFALLFSIASFYWMNWRRGRIHVGPPKSYVTMGSQDAKLTMKLPLVFFNSGAIPIVIQDLQLVFVGEKSPDPLVFTATSPMLEKSEGRALAFQFPVRGREAASLICEFQRVPGNLLFDQQTYRLDLEAKLDKATKWKQIASFELHVSEKAMQFINRNSIAHNNVP